MATEHVHTETIKALIEGGADVYATSKQVIEMTQNVFCHHNMTLNLISRM